MSTLEEEKQQRECRCGSDNQAKEVTQRKRDVPRKGAEEVFIEMLQYVPNRVLLFFCVLTVWPSRSLSVL